MNDAGQYPTWLLLIPVACILAGAAIWHLTRNRIRHAITARKFRRELDHIHPAEAARVENQIAEIKRRMRECSGESDDDRWGQS